MSRLNRIDWINLSVLVIFAAAIRIYRLGHASLWLDESYTIHFSELPWSTLWISAYDPTPPLHYSFIKLWMNFGHTESMLRFPSVVFGILTVIVIYIATRKIAGTLPALTASLMLVLSVHNIEYSQEARAYAPLGLWLSISFLGLVNLGSRWSKTTEDFSFTEFLKSGAGLYAIGLVCALYTHNAGFFYWLGAQFFFLGWWIRPFRFSRQCIAFWFLINFAVVVIWTPWMLASFRVIIYDQFTWLSQYEFKAAFDIWRSVHGISLWPSIDVFVLLFGLAGLYGLRENYAFCLLFVGLLISSSLFTWGYGFLSTPVFMLRTILWGSLFSAILVGVGVSLLPKYIGYLAFAGLVIFSATGVNRYFEYNQAEYEDWRSLAEIFKENGSTSDILLFRSSYLFVPFMYYVDDYSTDWNIVGWNCENDSVFIGEELPQEKIIRYQLSRSTENIEQLLEALPGANLWVLRTDCDSMEQSTSNGSITENWQLQETYEVNRVKLDHLIYVVSQ